MNKNKISIFFISTIIFAALAALVTMPNIDFGLSAGNTSAFNVSLTLNNTAPTISGVINSTDSPSEATTKTIGIIFNATDANGVGDIPFSNAAVKINKSGTWRNSSACTVIGTYGTTNQYNCTITINYWDTAGPWTINASVFDGASALAQDITGVFTMGTTYGITLKTNSLTFNGAPGNNDVNASNNPQVVNNTGNGAFNAINLTAYNLASGANQIGAGNFTANTTTSGGPGQALLNNTPVAILNSNISVLATRDLSIYLDIPTGTANGTYTSVASWVILMT